MYAIRSYYVSQIHLHLHVAQQCAHPAWRFLAAQAETLAQFERHRATNCHAFAVQQPVRIARCRLKRMAEGMAKVQKRAVASYNFV